MALKAWNLAFWEVAKASSWGGTWLINHHGFNGKEDDVFFFVEYMKLTIYQLVLAGFLNHQPYDHRGHPWAN